MAYDEVQPGSTALARRDTKQGAEIIPFDPTPLALRDTSFTKIAIKPVAKTAAKILLAETRDDEVDILPTGELYASQVHYRRRLTKAFGPMGWGLRPLTLESPDERIHQMFQRYALVAMGRVVATAVGSAKYFPTNREGGANARMDYADTSEALKSDALKKCCKDLNMFSELWDRRWCDRWREQHAVHVFVAVKQRDGGIKNEAWWRRLDAKPWPKEIEIVRDSPNQDSWRKQIKAWIALLNSEQEKSQAVANELRSARRAAGVAVKEAEQAVQETRREQQAPSRQDVESSQRTQNRPAQPVQHGAAREDLRPYLIRECKIVKRGPGYVLHRITMQNNQAWYTFSTSVYAELQVSFARRDQIEVTNHETHTTDGGQFRHIVEWKILKKGAQQE